jgi:hypothetical protein
MNPKEVKPTLEEKAPFVLCHPKSTGKGVVVSPSMRVTRSWRVNTSSAISALHSVTPAAHTKSVFLVAWTDSAYL